MGFDVRHVTDWTDHVWVEVYSYKEQKWVTCDRDYFSREREGKKLSYMVAVSNEEVYRYMLHVLQCKEISNVALFVIVT